MIRLNPPVDWPKLIAAFKEANLYCKIDGERAEVVRTRSTGIVNAAVGWWMPPAFTGRKDTR